MYETRYISSFCPVTKTDSCGYITIYDFKHFSTNQVLKWLHSLTPCDNMSYYPLWYWMTLILSIAGLVTYTSFRLKKLCIYMYVLAQLINVLEFYRMYNGMEPSSNFRHHIFRYVPSEFRRNVRVLSTVGMMNIYILFIFGVVKVSKLHVATVLSKNI